MTGNVDCHQGCVSSSGDEERNMNMNSVPSWNVTGGGGGGSGLAAPIIGEVASSAVFARAEAPADLDMNLPLTGAVGGGGGFRLMLLVNRFGPLLRRIP